MKKVWLSREMFFKIFKYVPRVAINILIKTPSGVVLSRRAMHPFKGYWHVPGSFLLKGETFEEACKRVAEKELGIKIEILKFLGAYETFKDTRGHLVNLNFLCRKVNGNFKPDENTLEINFFKKVPERIFPEHDKYIKGVLK